MTEAVGFGISREVNLATPIRIEKAHAEFTDLRCWARGGRSPCHASQPR